MPPFLAKLFRGHQTRATQSQQHHGHLKGQSEGDQQLQDKSHIVSKFHKFTAEPHPGIDPKHHLQRHFKGDEVAQTHTRRKQHNGKPGGIAHRTFFLGGQTGEHEASDSQHHYGRRDKQAGPEQDSKEDGQTSRNLQDTQVIFRIAPGPCDRGLQNPQDPGRQRPGNQHTNQQCPKAPHYRLTQIIEMLHERLARHLRFFSPPDHLCAPLGLWVLLTRFPQTALPRL